MRTSLRFRLPSRFVSWFVMLRRYVWLALALPCVYIGTATLGFGYRRRVAGATLATLRLPVMPAPHPTTRLMVFAPHCDDETLGCAGLIQQVLAAGGRVQVVILTNGDSFRTAVECETHNLRVTPRDYVNFARLRQQESLQALANLGVEADKARFLGYPDQGLRALWNTHWTPDHLYQSPTTCCDHAPYATIYHPNVGYCGQNILADIQANLRAFQPTLVTVTHPAEDHGDHAYAAAFVTRALQEIQEDQKEDQKEDQSVPADHNLPQVRNPNPMPEAHWAAKTRLAYYLIHRGDWPLPGAGTARTEDCPLVPPLEMLHTDTRWTSLLLTPLQTRRKAGSIRLYPSQTSMMDCFLNAFARRTELYGEIGTNRLAQIPDNVLRLAADAANSIGVKNINTNNTRGNTYSPVQATTDAAADVWQTLPPFLLDPVRDNVLRDLQGSGDIVALYACRDSRYLYLRLDCREPVSSRLTYTVHLRPFAKGGVTSTKTWVISLHATRSRMVTPEGVHVASHDRSLEAAVPWNCLAGVLHSPEHTNTNQLTRRHEDTKKDGLHNPEHDITALGISAETWAGSALSGLEIDKTGVRFLTIE